MAKNNVGLMGRVESCTTFGGEKECGILAFTVEGDGENVFCIESEALPPMINGQYVEGTAVARDIILPRLEAPDPYSTRGVVSLNIFDREGGALLHTFSREPY